MKAGYRRVGRVALVLTLGVAAGGGVADERTVTALPGTEYFEWSGALEQRTLGDGSVLSEYVASTDAVERSDVDLRVGFVPRFDCSPAIALRFAAAAAALPEAFYEDGDRLTLDIDDIDVEMPLIVDGDGLETTLWFDGGIERRSTLRVRIDVGSDAWLRLPNGESIGFSLIGSRRSLAATEAACRAHRPLPEPGR